MTGEGSLFDVPPAAIGRFRVLHQVGAGTSGPVFRAVHPDTEAPLAIKLFTLPFADPAAVARDLERLVAAAAASSGAPTLIAAGRHESTPFLVTTFAAGDPLDVALKQFGPAAIVDVLPRLQLLAAAMDGAAGQQVLHGALHPRDMLVSESETLLTGLGVWPILARHGQPMPVRRPYRAPELAEGAVSAAADRFAFAAITYEWMTGRRVPSTFVAGDMAPIAGADKAALGGAFARALHADPAERYDSCAAFVSALAAVAGDDLPPLVALNSTPEHEPEPRLRVEPVPPRRSRRTALPETLLPLDDFPPEDGAIRMDAAPEPELRMMPDTTTAHDELLLAPPPVALPDLDVPLHVEPPAVSPAPEPAPVERSAASLRVTPVERPAANPGVTPVERIAPTVRVRPVERSAPTPPATPIEPPVPPAAAPVEPRGTTLRVTPVAPPVPPPPPAAPVESRGATLRVTPVASVPAGTAAPAKPSAAAPRAVRRWPLGRIAAGLLFGAFVGLGVGYAFWGTGPEPADPTASVESGEVAGTAPAPPPSVAEGSGTPAAPAAVSPSSTAPSPSDAAGTPREARREGSAPAGRSTEQAAAPVTTAAGNLLIRSTPAGATVLVDDEPRGVTPLTLQNVAFGTRRVRVQRDGFAAEERQITLTRARPSRSVDVQLSRSAPAARSTAPRASGAAAGTAAARTGSLVIESRPPGATIQLNGRLIGATPMTIDDLEPGTYTVRLQLETYRPITTTVRVVAGARARAAASLTSVLEPQ